MNRFFAFKRQFIIFMILSLLLVFTTAAQESETVSSEQISKTYIVSTLFSSMHNSDILGSFVANNNDIQTFFPSNYDEAAENIISIIEKPVTEIYFYISPLDFFKSNKFSYIQNEISASIDTRRYEDIRRISSISEYRNTHGNNFKNEVYVSTVDASKLDLLRQIHTLCNNRGIDLKIILTPCYIGENASISYDSIKFLKELISEITPFSDFTCTPLSQDSRFFYNNYEARNTLVNEIASHTIALHETSLYDNFGNFFEKNSYIYENDKILHIDSTQYSINVPVLLYHHIYYKNFSNDIISEAGFKAQLNALKSDGFNTVSLKQLEDYVNYGTPLPDKPVCITFDDGYESNYNIAYRYMKKLGMKGTIFVIGSSVGKNTYKNTGYSIHPHFSLDQAKEMIDSGVMQIHSHTFDMHQSSALETGVIRESVAKLQDETYEEYLFSLEKDYLSFENLIYDKLNISDRYLAYPHGIYTDVTEQFYHNNGVSITMSTRSDTVNTIIKGVPQSLKALSRITISDNYTPEILVDLLNDYYTSK